MSEPVDKYRHKVQDNPQNSENKTTQSTAARYPWVCPPSQRLKKSALVQPGQPGIASHDDEAIPPSGSNVTSVEQVLEQELANSLSGFEAGEYQPIEDPDRQFEKACRDLVNKAREEMSREPSEDVEEDLAKIQATNMAMMNQSSPRDFQRSEADEWAPPGPGEPERVEILPETQPGGHGQYKSPSLATGMTAVVLAIVSTGVLLDVHKHPLVTGGMEFGSQLFQSDQPVPGTDAADKTPENTASNIAPETDKPAVKADKPVVEVSSLPEGAEQVAVASLSSRLDAGTQPAPKAPTAREELDVLTVNLKLTEAYLARLEQSIKNGNSEDTALLQAEALKVQREVDSLRSNILALDGFSSAARTKEAGSLMKEQSQVNLENNSAPAALALAAVNPEPEPAPEIESNPARDARLVETAIASTPGLKSLDPAQRSELQQKLVAGECLVPALTSVFPQVPVLVMRDMVRQLEDGC